MIFHTFHQLGERSPCSKTAPYVMAQLHTYQCHCRCTAFHRHTVGHSTTPHAVQFSHCPNPMVDPPAETQSVASWALGQGASNPAPARRPQVTAVTAAPESLAVTLPSLALSRCRTPVAGPQLRLAPRLPPALPASQSEDAWTARRAALSHRRRRMPPTQCRPSL